MSEFHAKRTRAKHQRRRRAHLRLRRRITGSAERPRLAVFKSLKYVYAQVIDDVTGRTLAQANSTEAEIAKGLEKSAASCEAATAVGAAVAERAKAAGVETVVFDRGGYVYHGCIRAVAEGAREKGLVF